MTKPHSSGAVRSEVLALLSKVYECFQNIHAWPTVRDVQKAFGPKIDVRLVAAQAGLRLIACEQSLSPRCILRRDGLEMVPEAAEDLDMYAKALGVIAERYNNNVSAVTQDDFREELQMSTTDLARLWWLLEVLGGPWRSSSFSNISGSFSLSPSEEAHFFAGVSTYAHAKSVQLEREEAAAQIRGKLHLAESSVSMSQSAAQPTIAPAGSEFFLANQRLNEVFQRDLNELIVVREAGAWKAALFLAGSCVEAILLDLLLRHPERQSAKQRSNQTWPMSGTLAQLAEAAERAGLISQNHKSMSAVFREWRNIIHPAKAMTVEEPTKELAEALSAYLLLLMSQLK